MIRTILGAIGIGLVAGWLLSRVVSRKMIVAIVLVMAIGSMAVVLLSTLTEGLLAPDHGVVAFLVVSPLALGLALGAMLSGARKGG